MYMYVVCTVPSVVRNIEHLTEINKLGVLSPTQSYSLCLYFQTNFHQFYHYSILKFQSRSSQWIASIKLTKQTRIFLSCTFISKGIFLLLCFLKTAKLFVLRDEQTQFFPLIHLESEKKLFRIHQARGNQHFFKVTFV